MLTKLRAKASPLRAELELRHLLPNGIGPECRYCGHEKEDASHVLNDCPAMQRQRDSFHKALDR